MASSPDAPKPVDPNTVINAEEQANRIGRVTPFGTQQYQGGNLVTTLPGGTQKAFDNITSMAGNQQQFMQSPNTGHLQDAILSKISSRYSQPQHSQKPASAQMSPTQMQGGNVMPTQGAWNQMFQMLGQQNQMSPPGQINPAMTQPSYTAPRQLT